ncbi:MAG: hypothetical protein VR70_03310 [Rhodospirillaceae bacterium BRH_c57]|nr:MAG: hypothetical protein VR70_03310 [Rhodospirillaceae bacterium BRH_c57]
MAIETLYICQPYANGKKGGLKPQPPISCKTEQQALQRAQRMMDGGSVAGIDVVRQSADPEMGDYEEPVYLHRLGTVPGGDG